MSVTSIYRESSDPLAPHPRTLVPYRVRFALELDQFLTRLALVARRVELTVRASSRGR